jgi:hypothetical protein
MLIDSDSVGIGEFVHLPVARDALAELRKKGTRCSFHYLALLRRCAAFALWLRRTRLQIPST